MYNSKFGENKMKKFILLACMLVLPLPLIAATLPSINGSFQFGGLIDGSTVDLPLFTDNEVLFENSAPQVGALNGDMINILGGHTALFVSNSSLKLQSGTYNDSSFLTFQSFDLLPSPTVNSLDFFVTLLTIDSVIQPTNSGLGITGMVMLSASGYADTLANLFFEISENGTYSSSAKIDTNISSVPAPAAIFLMLSGLPILLLGGKNKKI